MSDDLARALLTEPSDTSSTLGVYVAKRFIGDKGYVAGVPKEASQLSEKSDTVLFLADYGLSIACFRERTAQRPEGFSMPRSELIDMARACLPYTATVNGQKMPVGISLYELGDGPPSSSDIARLKGLHKAGFDKVLVTCFYLDTRNKTVWCSAAFNGLLRGRRWLEGVLREPRKGDGEIFVAEAAMAESGRPVATATILAILVAVFVTEQVLKAEASGLLGVDVGTLFAMGGMNRNGIIASGQGYRLLTAALLHVDAFHLLLNGIALGLSGYLLESLLGPAWLLVLFGAGALGGSLMGLAVNPPEVVSVGASGAVMGLLAAALAASVRFPRGHARSQIQVQLLQFLIPSLIPLATHKSEGHVDFAAHFGGALAGALCGWALLKIWPRDQVRPRFPRMASAFAGATALAFLVSAVLAKSNYASEAASARFSAAELLVPSERLPEDTESAIGEVETWGHGHPRDPRVHLYRAMGMDRRSDFAGAETELRAGLAEREIFDRAFPDGRLESALRWELCSLLINQGRMDEAKREAAPLCKARGEQTSANGMSAAGISAALRTSIDSLGLCD